MKKNKKDDYKIQVLKGPEQVRENSGMYIGDVDNGPNHLFYEIFDNSVDEALNGFADKIKVCIHKDFSISVEDNGRGIPVSYMKDQKKTELEIVFTTLHAGGKFGTDNKNYKYSGGLHGVGSAVTNFLSKRLRVIVWKDGKEYTMAFEDGLKIEEFSSKPIKSKKTGTFVRFVPSPEVFEKVIKFNSEEIETKIRDVSYLCRGLEIEFADETKNIKKVFSGSNDISKFVIDLSPRELISEPITFTDKKDNILVDISLQWNNGEEEISKYYTNNIPNSDGGSHMIGFKSALTRTINNYINSSDLPKTMKVALSGDDIREGLISIISIKMESPKFSSQTKEKLVSDDARAAVEGVVSQNMMRYLEQNPAVAKKIVTQCINAHKAREAAKKAREATRKSVLKDGCVLLPGKLADCSSKNPAECELFIVEGNSAGGCFSGNTEVSLATGGTISFKKLVEDWDNKKKSYSCLSINENGNVCVQSIINPRITKFDAEVIQLTFENGKKVICTPDHRFLVNKNKMEYERADKLFNRYVVGRFDYNKYNLKDTSGCKVIGVKILKKRMDVYDIEVPNTNNFLLDCGVFAHNSIKQGRDRRFQAVLPLRGKVLNVEKSEFQKVMANEELKNIITALGVGVGKAFNIDKLRYDKVVLAADADVDGAHIRTLLLTFFFRHMPQLIMNGNLYIACPPLYKITHRGRKYYVKDDNDLRSFIKEYNVQTERDKNGNLRYKGIRLQRFKGLGEMMPEQLWETTMDPELRKLLQVKIDDLVEADKLFNLLMGNQVEPRKQYIYENALDAINIDA